MMDKEATSKWAKHKRLLYIFSAIGILLSLSIYPLFKIFYVPPSCSDGKQNQMEVGVDCGGPCSVLCDSQVAPLKVDWVKVFSVSPGLYSVAAYVENPNRVAGVRNAPYRFTLYSADGAVVKEVEGRTFVDSRDRFVIFEPGIRFDGEVEPVSADISFGDMRWEVMQSSRLPITIKNRELKQTRTRPRLDATLVNNSVDDLFDLEAVAVVSDTEGKPVAVSSTFVDVLEKSSQKDIFFTWPSPISFIPEGGCTTPVDAMLVFDRSGSMGFEGSDPPQPLTEAKQAAIAFVESMSGKDKIGLVSFATEASDPIDRELSSDFNVVKDAIDAIAIKEPARKQHTNLGDGIRQATKELLSDRTRSNARKAMIVLTDGVASRPLNPQDKADAEYPSAYAAEAAKEAAEQGIVVYVIGLGDMVNEEFLATEIASAPENYYSAQSSADLKGIYQKIAKVVCKEEPFLTDIIIRRSADSVL